MHMLKWVGRFVFIMVVFVVTVPVLQYAQYARVEKYYVENLAGKEDDPSEYLVGISTMFGMDYFQDTPALTYTDNDHAEQDFVLDIYLFGVTEDKDVMNGFMLYLHDLSLVDDQGEVIINPIIKMTVQLNLETMKQADGTYTNRQEVVINPTNAIVVPMVFLVDNEDNLKVQDEDIYAEIERIEIEYSTGEKNDDGEYIYNDSYLLLITQDPSDELAVVKYDGISFTADDYQLRNDFADVVPTDAEITTFGLITDKDDISPYNWILWRTILVYTFIVFVLAYFLFFHKALKEKREMKRMQANSDPSKPKTEVIFKDEIEEKDGK